MSIAGNEGVGIEQHACRARMRAPRPHLTLARGCAAVYITKRDGCIADPIVGTSSCVQPFSGNRHEADSRYVIRLCANR